MPAIIEADPPPDTNPGRRRAKRLEIARGDGQSSDRRTQIVDAAARLFAELGYEKTSVRQIADEVNILGGSLYHHFATKEDILHEVLKPRLAQMTAVNRRMAHLPVDAECQLVASVILRFRQYVEAWQFHTILLQEGRFFRRQPDFQYVVEAKAEASALQQAVLREGMQAGLFRADLDPYLTMGTISRMLSSASSWFRSGDIFSSDKPTHYSLDSMIDYHLDCALRLVRTPARISAAIPRESCEFLLNGGINPPGADRG